MFGFVRYFGSLVALNFEFFEEMPVNSVKQEGATSNLNVKPCDLPCCVEVRWSCISAKLCCFLRMRNIGKDDKSIVFGYEYLKPQSMEK